MKKRNKKLRCNVVEKELAAEPTPFYAQGQF